MALVAAKSDSITKGITNITILPEGYCKFNPVWRSHIPQDDSKPGLGHWLQPNCASISGRNIVSQGILLSPAARAVLMTVSTLVVAFNASTLKGKNQ